MCLKYVKIQNSHPAGITHCYVPCGECADCRRQKQRAWQFRINSEFLYLIRQGWHVGFCTLTYNDEHLPKIPRMCFISEYKDIPCFSRSDVRQWIDGVRQYCKYHYDMTKDRRIRYFVASELGTLRHRPHYHAILAWPPDLSYEEMHRICTEQWNSKEHPRGFLFPRHYLGDARMMSFEVVGDASKCFQYISKYVCKDLELEKLKEGSKFYDDRKHYEEGSDERYLNDVYRNTLSFHIQSQSLGFEAIKNLTDEEKMEVFANGLSFVGDGEIYQVPMYIKNKLVYDPYYVYDENGKRLVRRQASDFFLNHAAEIFERKADWYTKLCRASESAQYYKDRGLDDATADNIASYFEHYVGLVKRYMPDAFEGNNMGKYYLAYHRVSPLYRYEDIAPLSQWLLRWYPEADLIPSSYGDFNYRLSVLDNYWNMVDNSNALLGSFGEPDRAEREHKVSKVLDFFNNLQGVK